MTATTTTAAAMTAIAASASTTTTASAAASAITAPISATITLRRPAGMSVLAFGAIEIGFAFRCGGLLGAEIAIPAFKSHTAANWSRSFAAAHLGALLLENGLAGEPDTVAFNGKHLDQHLIAFFEFIANVANAMLGHFANVQQAVGTREYLDESAEIRQTNDLAKISLANFWSGREIADHLQSPIG